MYKIYNENNDTVLYDAPIDIFFADYVYENLDFSWAKHHWNNLKTGGIFIAMTDWHSNAEYKVFMKTLPSSKEINDIVWKNEWGNHPKDRFHQCYDNIIIFSKGAHKFYPERVQVPKVTVNTKLNPSDRETKTATAWIDDICLTTTSKERIKKPDGHLIRWQKPIKLIDRLIQPFSNENDMVVDLFMGSGSVGEWCILNNRNYIGYEIDSDVFELAKTRLERLKKWKRG